VATDRDFGVFKIISLVYFIFLHKHVKQSMLKSDRLYHYNIKIIFCGYSKLMILFLQNKEIMVRNQNWLKFFLDFKIPLQKFSDFFL